MFFHPVARALIDERKKLLQNPYDDNLRGNAANLMANIAHQPSAYRGDPVVMMALRSGAVRLVLDRGSETVPSVNEILWQAAVRIEDGTIGEAEKQFAASAKRPGRCARSQRQRTGNSAIDRPAA